MDKRQGWNGGGREDAYDMETLRLELALRIIRRCTDWLKKKDRLKEEGIFRVSGSVQRIKALGPRLADEASQGDGSVQRVDLDEEQIHTVAGTLKHTLIDIDPPLLPAQTWKGLLDAQFGKETLATRVRTFREWLQALAPARLAIMQHIFEFLREVVKEQKHNLMGATNICRVFAATIFRHTDGMKSALYLAGGQLPAVCLTVLLSDALLPTNFHPQSCKACSLGEVAPVLGEAEAGLTSTSDPHLQTQQHALPPHTHTDDPRPELQGPSSEGNNGWLGIKLPLFQPAKQDDGEQEEGWMGQVGSWFAPPKMPSSGGGLFGIKLPWGEAGAEEPKSKDKGGSGRGGYLEEREKEELGRAQHRLPGRGRDKDTPTAAKPARAAKPPPPARAAPAPPGRAPSVSSQEGGEYV